MSGSLRGASLDEGNGKIKQKHMKLPLCSHVSFRLDLDPWLTRKMKVRAKVDLFILLTILSASRGDQVAGYQSVYYAFTMSKGT